MCARLRVCVHPPFRPGGIEVLHARRGHLDGQDQAEAVHHQAALAAAYPDCESAIVAVGRGERPSSWRILSRNRSWSSAGKPVTC